jgi:mRNA-degrading endonuclease toxin of MazEF toxin-antitoxin module
VARGEILALQRRLGFGPGNSLEHFAVLQADELSGTLETFLVAPLDSAFDFWAGLPGTVRISGKEAGVRGDQVILVSQLCCVPADRFQPVPVGRLRRDSLARVERIIRLVLDLD